MDGGGRKAWPQTMAGEAFLKHYKTEEKATTYTLQLED